jgi:excinuclease ABC subunit A
MSARHRAIRIRGARQNNLKNLDLDLPTGELIVVTGVSGSGKSSLVFDTLYAEGQRRYVETFSPYARQFLDRMDRPAVDRIDGVPPAIAIDQTNPVRTSRSTVGTMTELNDHLKLLFARAAVLHCRNCGNPVRRDSPQQVADELIRRCARQDGARLTITFPISVPANFTAEEIRTHLEAQGYTRVHAQQATASGQRIDVIQDRVKAQGVDRQRLLESIEAAMHRGSGRVDIHRTLTPDPSPASGRGEADGSDDVVWRFSSDLHCPDCDIHYSDPTPSAFSFNSPLGACTTCRGFGRVIGIDLGLVIPDPGKSLRGGAVKPWQTKSFKECQRDLEKFAPKFDVALDVAWSVLSEREQRWVIDGDPAWTGRWQTQWYGIRRYFEWLESKAYRMHIRVLLSRYRSYTPCPACAGSRLQPDALLWRFEGHTIQQLALLPLQRLREFFDSVRGTGALDQAIELLLREIRARLRFLCEVGVGYLTLDRQSRTLSGGEVQRINLTTALGTSLVNTLFVLDEPSIGLHPRDMHRVVGVMRRLRSAGNSLVVVEHDPQVMLAADRVLDLGPGPGERGGQVVFEGSPEALCQASTLTGQYLSGRRQVESPRARPVAPDTARIVLQGAREHNLKNLDVQFPLNRIVVVTGVSGSGKSTLVQNVLYPALRKAMGKPADSPGLYDDCRGAERIEDVTLVDQSPIGKTTRSNPASYVGAFDAIRRLFARAPLALERGYTAGTFSFNAGTGRCPTCGGNGYEHVEMQFLSDVYLRCPDCDGRRFRGEVLEVTLERNGGELSVADTLELTVSEALERFSDDTEVVRGLAPLAEVGLEYLRLGQPVPTLSGGEAQRLKIAGFLAKAQPVTRAGTGLPGKATLMLFDEPTTGLHFDDIARLMRALRRLIDCGHSLILIEHNLDVIRAADWIIDLGPEGGEGGGQIVAEGEPRSIAAHPTSHTGRALREYEATLTASTLTPAPSPTGVGEGSNNGACSPLSSPAGVGDGTYGTASPLPLAGEGPGVRAEDVASTTDGWIEIRNAREHNLKGIDVAIPRDAFTVITGVSGSGKSTLAFDILFNEGQRRYLESLNAYARSIVQPAGRPDVDAIYGIAPTVSIEQRVSRGGRKSTVATQTEVHHFLRLLFVKLGVQHCPDCHIPVTPLSFDSIVAQIGQSLRGQHVGVLAPLIIHRKGYYTELAKWAAGRGHTHLRVDGQFVPTSPWARLDRFREHTIELPLGDLRVEPESEAQLRQLVQRALELGHGVVQILWPLEHLKAALQRQQSAELQHRLFSIHRTCPSCGRAFPEPDPRLFSYNSKHGWCPDCFGTGLRLPGFGAEHSGEEIGWNDWYEGEASSCPTCDGQRLNRVALAVHFDGRSIAQVGAMTVAEASDWLDALSMSGRQLAIARDIVTEIRGRLDFLIEVGLGYLTLDRAAPTLSGGESQRIRLAAQLGSNLQGVCYVLDEPTIGLHARDNRILLSALSKLRERGNSLVVVEHDEDTIRAADHLIDMGPGAGIHGGRVVAQGTIEDLVANPQSVTGRFLREPPRRNGPPRHLDLADPTRLTVRAAKLHNLRGIDVDIPLARLTVVTGVSGSGKSTLARDVLLRNLQAALAERSPRSRTVTPSLSAASGRGEKTLGRKGQVALPSAAPVGEGSRVRAQPTWKGCAGIDGWTQVARVLEVDQTPIGKTPRSCPATYVGFWDAIRKRFADTSEARIRGYGPGRFSFNTAGGRCTGCEGQGLRTIEMNFLPDVKVVCDVCGGSRFDRATLEVRWRDRSIGDVLAMQVDEAVEFFAATPAIEHPLSLLRDVGLGYLTLGQASPTLSGGEAQRIKLVTELARARVADAASGTTLYVLDEPTVGLSMADIEKLLAVIHRLVDAGHTVVIIEHNLDVVADADWIIDLGPEGGSGGGRLIAADLPTRIARCDSPTGAALRAHLERNRGSIAREATDSARLQQA